MTTKSAAVEAAATAGDPAALRSAQDEWETAAAEYASTDEGHRHLIAQATAADASGDLDTAALLNTVVRRGDALRAANRETAALMKAVRLSQSEPSATSSPAALVPVAPTGPVVPDLSVEDRAKWTASLQEMGELSQQFTSVFALRGNAYAADLREGLPKIDQTISKVDADDDDLAQAVRSSAYYGGVKYSVPQWTRPDELERDHEARAARNIALGERWRKFLPQYKEALEAQAARALSHPNADAATYAQYEESQFATSEDLTARPDVPMSYLKKTIATKNGDSAVHEAGWEKARAARFNDNSMALLLAAKDPDSFHRNEAFNQVMMAPLDTLSAKDRKWLATNLHKMPGGEENQRILADSLKSWAMGYTDAAERQRLGAALSGSQVASVSAIGNALVGNGDKPVSLTRQEPKRRGLFSRS